MILQAQNLTKRFFNNVALEDLTFTANPGEFIGLLGVNGSGKSTLIKMAEGLVKPTGGSIKVLGQTPGANTRRMVAYLPEIDHLYMSWNARYAFDFMKAFFPMSEQRFKDVLEFLSVSETARLGTLSKGNRTRVRLALTLARDAKLYLLDEPLSGIDPLTREQILHTLIREFRADDADSTMILATHQIAEAESLFDRVLVLDGGRVLLEGTAEDIRNARGVSIDRAVKQDAMLAESRRRGGK